MSRRHQDAYGRKAKREGFPARSVYKLEEIDRRLRLLKPGQRVLELGAAPGSWTLYAAKKIGQNGRMLAYDLQPQQMDAPPWVVSLQADVEALRAQDLEEHGPFDLVLSDMAPATTGQRAADQYRSYLLLTHALELACEVLKPGGAFVGKVFQSPDVEQARAQAKEAFTKVRLLRPGATRKESYEVFLAGVGRK